MTLEQARIILKDELNPDGGLYCLGHYMAWTPGDSTICLDSDFEVEELEAIVCIMRFNGINVAGVSSEVPR